MTEEDLIRGWPFTGHMPLRIGEVDGIAWAIAAGGPDGMRTINGYARIPWEGHPWTGCIDYDKLPVQVHGGLTFGPKPEIDMQASLDALVEATADSEHPFRRPPRDRDLPPHPAVTFADCGGWVGFDTGHAWDYWPVAELRRWGIDPGTSPHPPRTLHDHRWTGDEVIAEAKRLAEQIAKAGRSS